MALARMDKLVKKLMSNPEAFWNIFPIGSNVKLSPAVAAILNFISEQKTYNL